VSTTAIDINKIVSITNGSSVDVAPIDAYQPSSGDGSTPAAEQMYEQTLTPLRTTDGAATIAAGTTATVTLDGTYLDQGTAKYRTLYDLIFARPADLFPVKVTGEMLGMLNPVYPPITVAATDEANYALALTFLINLMAYPTSDMAKNYQAAMNSAQQTATKPGDLDTAMAAFFAGTKQYKPLTVGHVTAVTSYVNAFAFLWAGTSSQFASFSDTCTYYLYRPGTPEPAPGGDSGPPTAVPVLVGTLALAKSPNRPSPAAVTDSNGGYAATFTDAAGATTTMWYQNGQFVSDKTSDTPTIALRGSYVLKSQLTNNTSDTVLVPVMAGQVSGVKVMGTTTEQNEDDLASKLWAFFHPQTFGQWLNFFLAIFGVLMALDFLAKGIMATGRGLKGLWDKYKGNEPPPSEIEELRAQVRNLGNEIRQNQQALLDRLDAQRQARVPEAAEVGNAVDAARNDLADNLRGARQAVVQEALQQQAGQVEKVAEFGVDAPLAEVADNIRNDGQAIEQAPDGPAMDKALDQAAAHIPANELQIQQSIAKAESQLSAADKAELADASADVQELHEAQDAADRQKSDAEDGEGGDDEDVAVEE
jgi:hypothetical protein